jgi:hypothetical protein
MATQSHAGQEEQSTALLKELERQDNETEAAHLVRITQLGRERGRMLNRLSKQLYLKNNTKRGRHQGTGAEIAARKELASRQIMLAALQRVPEDDREIHRELGMEPIYESPNTVGWLEDIELGSSKKRIDETPIMFVWALKFKMPHNSSQAENEQLASVSVHSRARHHVDTESDADLAARTVLITDIPIEHIHLPDSSSPEPSPELLTKLNITGDASTEVDAITVRVRSAAEGNSLALVTFSVRARTSQMYVPVCYCACLTN